MANDLFCQKDIGFFFELIMLYHINMEIVNKEIEEYALKHSSKEPEILEQLGKELASRFSYSSMAVGPIEGRFLEFLVYLLNPKKILEIGTFGGYSSIFMAQALKDGAKIYTCEINDEHINIARSFFEKANLKDKIEILPGNATETIRNLKGPWDLIFIDADKTSYLTYYEYAIANISDNGLIVIDNTLWSGKVISDDNDPDTEAIRKLNDFIVNDPRAVVLVSTIRDGITLIRKG
jgi:caffeoyl-CoA O-methyltransferase